MLIVFDTNVLRIKFPLILASEVTVKIFDVILLDVSWLEVNVPLTLASDTTVKVFDVVLFAINWLLDVNVRSTEIFPKKL